MTRSTEMFFALLRLSLNESSFDSSTAFANADAADWEQVFSLSARQGTVLLTYGGLQHLPAQMQPPRKLKLRWCANVIKGSERYDRYGTIIKDLSDMFSENGMEMLILKGVTISRLYPVPYYREGGDLDIYLFGKGRRADDLLSSMGIKVNHPVAKHSAFRFEGQMIENHRTFFDTDIGFRRESRLYRRMENMLKETMAADGCPELNVGSVRQLSPQAAALFMIGHTFRHFCCIDINVKQLCDWTVLFTRCRNEIDGGVLAGQIKELGLERFVAAINSFCAARLGFEPPFAVSGGNDKNTDNSILKMVMKYRVAPKIRIPVVGPMRRIASRNRIYNKYLGKSAPSEFLLPESKSYFSYLLRRIKMPRQS